VELISGRKRRVCRGGIEAEVGSGVGNIFLQAKVGDPPPLKTHCGFETAGVIEISELLISHFFCLPWLLLLYLCYQVEAGFFCDFFFSGGFCTAGSIGTENSPHPGYQTNATVLQYSLPPGKWHSLIKILEAERKKPESQSFGSNNNIIP